MREFEQIDIYNVSNGERFTTYVIVAQAGSGVISMNGAAARRCQVGDKIIIATYGEFSEAEAAGHQPTLLCLTEHNSVECSTNTTALQTAPKY